MPLVRRPASARIRPAGLFLDFPEHIPYTCHMMTESIGSNQVSPVQEMASIKTLKNALHAQEQAAMKLLESLSAINDPALGRNIDTSA